MTDKDGVWTKDALLRDRQQEQSNLTDQEFVLHGFRLLGEARELLMQHGINTRVNEWLVGYDTLARLDKKLMK